MSHAAPPPSLPGACADPGSGPVEAPLLDDLLDDAGPLAGHLDLLGGDRRDLLAALAVPAALDATTSLVQALLADPRRSADGVRIVLVADSLDDLRAARTPLEDVDAVELVGVRLRLPGSGSPGSGSPGSGSPGSGSPGSGSPGSGSPADPARAARRLLAELDSSVPAWIVVPPGEAAAPVLDVLAEDGAEHAALDVSTGAPGELGTALRLLVDHEATFRVAGTAGVHRGSDPDGAPGGAPGLLNVLAATRAALGGAEPAELAEILALRDSAPLASALRWMSAADAAVLRAFLVAVEVPDAAAASADLAAAGLLGSPDAWL